MWRAFFLAVGFFVVTLGAECLVMDRFVMASEQPQQQVGMYTFQPPADANRDIVPAEWAPWTMLSTGAVMILYSLTLNRGQ